MSELSTLSDTLALGRVWRGANRPNLRRRGLLLLCLLGCFGFAFGTNSACAQTAPPPGGMGPYGITPPGGYGPHANNDTSATLVGMFAMVPVLNNDTWLLAPLDIHSVEIVDAPQHGSAHVDTVTGNVWYFASPGFAGTDTLTYTVLDMFGQESNVATVTITVTDLPPSIVEFHASPTALNVWKFAGRVLDESAGGLTVTFGGLLTGRSATVAADGTFSLVLTLSPGQGGLVTAQTMDAHNTLSNVAQDFVFNMPPNP